MPAARIANAALQERQLCTGGYGTRKSSESRAMKTPRAPLSMQLSHSLISHAKEFEVCDVFAVAVRGDSSTPKAKAPRSHRPALINDL